MEGDEEAEKEERGGCQKMRGLEGWQRAWRKWEQKYEKTQEIQSINNHTSNHIVKQKKRQTKQKKSADVSIIPQVCVFVCQDLAFPEQRSTKQIWKATGKKNNDTQKLLA